MRHAALGLAMLAALTLPRQGHAQSATPPADITYPQIIHARYEAVDKKGGQFILWSERERIFYGLDARLYPPAAFVEVTQTTPSVGSITLTTVEVRTIASNVSDYLYMTGNVRFRVSGMALKSSNVPKGLPLSTQ